MSDDRALRQRVSVGAGCCLVESSIIRIVPRVARSRQYCLSQLRLGGRGKSGSLSGGVGAGTLLGPEGSGCLGCAQVLVASSAGRVVMHVVCGGWSRLLFENYTVDASIL